uniref:Fibronectin type-III domain-containing protein n=1 Tax=Oryzias sinensis TaxID=183150 RepID=A0A8C7ZYH8_9TELE
TDSFYLLIRLPHSVAPKPNIPYLKAFSKKQSLVVTLPARHTDGENDTYEIQIGRTETQSIIYSRKVRVSAAAERTWTWISDLPLECVDHSVRIRYFCNQSALSPWSSWTTNHGVKGRNKLRIFPSDRVLQEGKSAKFCCVAPQGVKIASINFGNNHFPSTSIGATVEAITVNNLTIPTNRIKSSLLTCTEGTGKKAYAWNYVSFPPQKPQNLSCATSDMKTVVCNWSSGRKRDEFDHNTQTYTLHIKNSDQGLISCETSSCRFPAVPQLQEYNISVMVKDQLGEETESYSFNISERGLRPNPKWMIKIIILTRGVTNVSISWRVVGNLTQMVLICQVSATPGNTTQQVDCNSSSHVCKAEVEHLHPSTEYSIVVRCSTNGKLWGNWSKPKLFKTCNDRAVSIQSYRVQWSQKDRMWTNVTDGRQNQLEVTIGPEKCNFTVEAILEMGYRAAAHITIPPAERQEAQVVKRQLKSSSADGIRLSWDKDRAVTCGYTVEWCTLGSAVPCTLKWIEVPKGNNSLFLSSRNFTAGLRYSFNIYGCTENGHKLLEVQTGYSKELSNLVQPVQTTSSSATLEWLFNEHDPAHPAFIIGYLITVQGGRSDKAPDQATSVSDPLQKSVTIEGLQPNQEYVCSVSKVFLSFFLKPALSIVIFMFVCFDESYLLQIFLFSLLLSVSLAISHPYCFYLFFNYCFLHFCQTIQRLASQRIDECISCEIEILNVGASATARKPDFTNDLCSPGTHSSPSSTSASCISVQRGYCPQSAVVLVEKPTCLQMACVINKSYFSTIAESPEIAADST